MELLENTKLLSIPFQDIKSATNNFQTPIGNGGFGMVYKGEMLWLGKLTSVAVKRLDTKFGQGDKEFLTEIQMLSRCKHKNLVSLVGFCREGHENILIYEYAERGSLDNYHHVEGKTCSLTWKQRINICIDAARGLNYLHNDVAEKERIIHRDLKSANILLDHNWKAMIADFGLSKLGRANEDVTYLITHACGTPGYCDPLYMETGVLTKESDVYSFGVVLFEVLCGRLGYRNINNEHRFLALLAQHCYEKGKLNEIIDPCLKDQMDSDSMNAVSEIAYQCLNKNREERPSMDFVVEKLVEALQMEVDDKDIEWDNYLPSDYKQFIYYSSKEMMAMPPKDVNFLTKKEAYSILTKGVRIKVESGVDMWFWITKSNGKKCFMLSPDEISGIASWFQSAPASPNESRFGKVLFKENAHSISMMFRLIYPLLSTKTTYACYLVYKMQYYDPCFEQPWDVIVDCRHTKKEDMHLGIPVSDRRPFHAFRSKKARKIFLRRPRSPPIKPYGLIEDSSNPLNKRINMEFPRKRKDGWWEVSLGELISDYTPCDETSDITSVRPDYDSHIQIKMCQSGTFKKLIVHGIEFRPF